VLYYPLVFGRVFTVLTGFVRVKGRFPVGASCFSPGIRIPIFVKSITPFAERSGKSKKCSRFTSISPLAYPILTKIRLFQNTLLPAMGFADIVADSKSVCHYRSAATGRVPSWVGFFDRQRPNGTRIPRRAPDRLEVGRLAEIARSAGALAFEPPHVCITTRAACARSSCLA